MSAMDQDARNGAKRRSGHQESFSTPIQRRSSKKSSSKDRHGKIYVDGFKDKSIRTVTPESSPPTSDRTQTSIERAPLRSTSTPDSFSRSQDAKRAHDKSNITDLARHASSSGKGPKLLEEPNSDSSPSSVVSRVSKARQRLGSIANNSFTRSTEDAASIGYPSIIQATPAPLAHGRQKLMKSPPHPLSPTALQRGSELRDTGPLSPFSIDPPKLLDLMKTLCGRMNGFLFFRTPENVDWIPGYGAINVASGSLMHQDRRNPAPSNRILISDLRGCNVQTGVDEGARQHYLSISAASSRLTIQIRPSVPETLSSWLAALLCWQPLAPKGAQGKLPKPQPSTLERRPRDGRRASEGTSGKSAIIKVGKLQLWEGWHQCESKSCQSPTSRTSQRPLTSSWRRVSFVLHENGQFKLLDEAGGQPFCTIDLPALSRSAIQQLDPSVLDAEYSIAVYHQYTAQPSFKTPAKSVFFGLDSRVSYEVLFVLLRGFATPILYSTTPDGPQPESRPAQGSFRNSKTKADMCRVEKQLEMRLTEAKLLTQQNTATDRQRSQTSSSQQTPGDSYAEILLDSEVGARTAIRPGQPFWREDFIFHDIAPSLSSVSVLIRSRDPSEKEWTMIAHEPYALPPQDGEPFAVNGDIEVSSHDRPYGEVIVQLEDLVRGEEVERWWPVLDLRGQKCGELFMKIRLNETTVLMSEDYGPLLDLLKTFSNGLTIQIAQALPAEAKRLSEVLLNIFQVSGESLDWLRALIEDEIDGVERDNPAQRLRYVNRIHSQESYDSASEREMLVREVGRTATLEANLLFRGNSLLTFALDAHCRRLGKDYLEETIGAKLREIDETQPNCEVDPNRIENPQEMERNWRTLIALTNKIWEAIHASAARCPPEMRLLFRHIRSCAEDRYGDWIRTVSYSSVSGFLFLRFFCPAILNPKLFGLMKDHPRSNRSTRALLLITKSLQGLANMTNFGSKEPWMEPMNKFLIAQKTSFKNFIDQICAIPTERTSRAMSPSYTTPIQILARLPQTCREGFPSLPFLLDSARCFAELIALWLRLAPPDVVAQLSDIPHSQLTSFHYLCITLETLARNRFASAEQAERPQHGLEPQWERLLEERVRATGTFYQGESPAFEESGFDWGTTPTTPASKRRSLMRSPTEGSAPSFRDGALTWDSSKTGREVDTTVGSTRPTFMGRQNSETAVSFRMGGGDGDESKNSSLQSLEVPISRRKTTPVTTKKGLLDLVNVSGSKRGKDREEKEQKAVIRGKRKEKD